MRKTDIDHQLEAAVARALGVAMPRPMRKRQRARRALHQPAKRAA